MTKKQLKLNLAVFDRWWPWNLGVITKITKSSVTVTFNGTGKCIYDYPHIQFLEIVLDRNDKNIKTTTPK